MSLDKGPGGPAAKLSLFIVAAIVLACCSGEKLLVVLPFGLVGLLIVYSLAQHFTDVYGPKD